jgi:5'-phosphate synthase pdxT subunit
VKKRIGVLALQGDVREHSVAIQKSGAVASLIRRPDDLKSIDALILPGGESTTISKLLHFFRVFQPIKEAIESGMPVFGTCAGMILLANQILDGSADQDSLSAMDITVRRNAFGRQVDSFEKELDLRSINAGKVTAIFIRAPWIERHGPDVEVIASVESAGQTHPVLARQGKMLAASFHPEILEGERYLIHEFFIKEVAS